VLKSGMQTEYRRFDDGDDILKCLAFDAITGWRVFELYKIVKTDPERLASGVTEPAEVMVLRILLNGIGSKNYDIRSPLDLTVSEFVVDLGRTVGFRTTKKQPLPRTRML